MKIIESQHIGQLRQNEEFDDWWESDPVPIPLFDRLALPITFMDLVPSEDANYIAEADIALGHFLAKGHDARMQLSELVHQNCMDFLNTIGYDEMDKPMWELQDANGIWQFVHPQEIRLSRRHRRDKDLYLSIECECDWEQEHGLQLVFRQGKQITRVSAQDGWTTEADAFGKSDDEDELLSSFRG